MKYYLLFFFLFSAATAFCQESLPNYIPFSPKYNEYSTPNEDFELAKMLYDSQKYDEAIDKLSDIIDKDPDYYHAYYKRAYSYYHLKQYEFALKDIELMYDIVVKDHKYYYFKGMIYDKMGRTASARFFLQLAINSQPHKYYYYKYRAAFYLEKGEYKKAINDYNVVIGVNPNDYKSYFGRGMAKFNGKQKKEACIDWLHARDHDQNCKRYFFYRCTDIDFRGTEVDQRPISIPDAPVYQEGIAEGANSKFTEILSDLFTHIRYPLDDQVFDGGGTALVKFTVGADKRLGGAEVVYSPNEAVEKAILNSLKNIRQEWTSAATLNGENVGYTYYVPIKFGPDLDTVRINELLDRLETLKGIANHQEIFELTNQILNRNLFVIEALKMNKAASENLGVTYAYSSIDQLGKANLVNGELHGELQVYSNLSRLYFNDSWNYTTANKASYIRLAAWDLLSGLQHGPFKDSYPKSQIMTKGNYLDGKKDGKFELFYPNGRLKSKMIFKGGKLDGVANFFHENGNLQHSLYISGDEFLVRMYCDSTGKQILLEGNGDWSFETLDYTGTNKIVVKGSFSKQKKDGIWQLYFADKLEVEEIYEEGAFVGGHYFSDGKKKNLKQAQIGSWVFVPFYLDKVEKHSEPGYSIEYE